MYSYTKNSQFHLNHFIPFPVLILETRTCESHLSHEHWTYHNTDSYSCTVLSYILGALVGIAVQRNLAYSLMFSMWWLNTNTKSNTVPLKISEKSEEHQLFFGSVFLWAPNFRGNTIGSRGLADSVFLFFIIALHLTVNSACIM